MTFGKMSTGSELTFRVPFTPSILKSQMNLPLRGAVRSALSFAGRRCSWLHHVASCDAVLPRVLAFDRAAFPRLTLYHLFRHQCAMVLNSVASYNAVLIRVTPFSLM